MLVLGATSDISQAFTELYLSKQQTKETIHLVTSNVNETEKFSNHIKVKYEVPVEVYYLNLMEDPNHSFLNSIDFETVFCATGFLGLDTENGLYDDLNTQKIININYAKLVPVLNVVAKKLEEKGKGDIIILSSVAGDRGRQSNFIYGSAKAAITAYASGLRNYLTKRGVHVLTVKPGFMDTKMTRGLDLPKPITATPKQAAKAIYVAYRRKQNVAYVLWMWYFIMLIIRNIPEFIFKKMKI